MIKWLSTSTPAFASPKLAGWACASLKNFNPPCRLPPSLSTCLPHCVRAHTVHSPGSFGTCLPLLSHLKSCRVQRLGYWSLHNLFFPRETMQACSCLQPGVDPNWGGGGMLYVLTEGPENTPLYESACTTRVHVREPGA